MHITLNGRKMGKTYTAEALQKVWGREFTGDNQVIFYDPPFTSPEVCDTLTDNMVNLERQINKALHEYMGNCWHEFALVGEAGYRRARCTKPACGILVGEDTEGCFPNYLSSESPRHLLEDVIKKIDNDEAISSTLSHVIGRTTFEIRAKADDIAIACYEVILSEGMENK